MRETVEVAHLVQTSVMIPSHASEWYRMDTCSPVEQLADPDLGDTTNSRNLYDWVIALQEFRQSKNSGKQSEHDRWGRARRGYKKK
ncbi:MAG: hypothetical protein D6704_09710 [Nitrospirae bacterium]|nr:MAG: hypothetical protein D6704_09710 [Nitrospirota bacterium]